MSTYQSRLCSLRQNLICSQAERFEYNRVDRPVMHLLDCGVTALVRRVVLDTNVLVGGAYAAHSASRRIIEACLRDELRAIISSSLRREYEFIVTRAVRGGRFTEELRALIDAARVVEPTETPRIVPDDPDDDKLLAAALAGDADAVVTNDRHLLTLDPYQHVRIVRPTVLLGWGWLEPEQDD